MLMFNARGCNRISRERGSGRLILTTTGGAAAGALHLRQEEDHTWWAYSEPTAAYIPLESGELLDDLLTLECEFRANELIGWEYRPHRHPALASELVRRASQARVAELEREQRRRRGQDESLGADKTRRRAGGFG
jgi:hypothetical protein